MVEYIIIAFIAATLAAIAISKWHKNKTFSRDKAHSPFPSVIFAKNSAIQYRAEDTVRR